MLSWYHSGFDTEPDLTHPWYLAVEEAIPFSRKWGDFSLCSWPVDLVSHEVFASTSNDSTRLAEALGLTNEGFLYPLDEEDKAPRFGLRALSSDGDDFIISFSHFLTRQELCPEKRFLTEPLLSRVIGSKPLEEQLFRLQPNLHLFGHTHIPIDMTLDDIRYIQWPLGYGRESQRQCFPVYSSGPLLVYDSSLEETGFIPSDLASRETVWTQHYETHPREPDIVDKISPWLEKRLESFSGLVYTHLKRTKDNDGSSQ